MLLIPESCKKQAAYTIFYEDLLSCLPPSFSKSSSSLPLSHCFFCLASFVECVIVPHLHAHSSDLYCSELITQWYQKFILQRSTITLPFNNYSKAEITFLLIRFKNTSFKFSLWNTKNTDRNHVWAKDTYTHTTHWTINIRKG